MEGRRGKQKEKHKAHIKMNDFYEFFAHSFFAKMKNGRNKIDKSHKYYVDKSTYASIVSEFNEGLKDLVLYKSMDISLPSRMGVMCIRKRKIEPYIDKNGKFVNTLPPDWKRTLELWAKDPKAKENKTLIRHTNEHTNGFIPTWKYMKQSANYKWKTAYNFIFCRSLNLELASILKDENSTIDYYEE